MGKRLIFIHGFLGQPQDWDSVLKELSTTETVDRVDLNRDFSVSDLNFNSWPQAFEQWLKKRKITQVDLIVGYSLGGRLTLPLIESGICQKAILLSPHLGLAENATSERHQRNSFNNKWAHKFLNEDFRQVVTEWNQQEVFQGSSSEIERQEEQYDRKVLAQLLTGFSLGDQKDYSTLLRDSQWTGIYLAGRLDKKYSQYAEGLNLPQLSVRWIEHAGHRLLFDQPAKVAREISNFLENL